MAVAAITQGNDAKEGYNGWHIGLAAAEMKSESTRTYWPAAVVTNAQGKFRIDDATPRRAVAELLIDAPDFPSTSVAVKHPESLPWNLQANYRESPFMLVLEAPYVVEGRFLDEKTQEPIKDVRIEVQPRNNRAMREHGNGRGHQRRRWPLYTAIGLGGYLLRESLPAAGLSFAAELGQSARARKTRRRQSESQVRD